MLNEDTVSAKREDGFIREPRFRAIDSCVKIHSNRCACVSAPIQCLQRGRKGEPVALVQPYRAVPSSCASFLTTRPNKSRSTSML